MSALDQSFSRKNNEYKYGFVTDIETERLPKGLNEEIIRDTISYEIGRSGQVFFVHNRVQNIHEVAGMIARLCPGANIAVGHGQMDGKKLEICQLFNFVSKISLII